MPVCKQRLWWPCVEVQEHGGQKCACSKPKTALDKGQTRGHGTTGCMHVSECGGVLEVVWWQLRRHGRHRRRAGGHTCPGAPAPSPSPRLNDDDNKQLAELDCTHKQLTVRQAHERQAVITGPYLIMLVSNPPACMRSLAQTQRAKG